MAGWELALVIMAVTFMVVNMANVIIQLVWLSSLKGLVTKSVKTVEKLIDKSDKAMDEIFEDL